ncbi:MAG: hypothetical protein AB7V19_06555, partial [Candidatus Bipolaricaulia bacterium]
MEPIFVDERLAQHGVLSPTFQCLTSDSARYRTIVLQPAGDVVATDAIRPAEPSNVGAKLEAFLSLATDAEADLAIAPEYSCPWETLTRVLRDGPRPAPGALWIIGCEGITLDELEEIQREHPSVVWIMDERCAPSRDRPPQYVDPVCFLFVADAAGGGAKLVVVLQFKGQPMYDPIGRFEAENMVLGRERFVLRNPEDENSTRLVVLVCSDTLGNLDAEGWLRNYYAPLIVVHTQLCTSPRNEAFMSYRLTPFRHKAEHTEIVCLNWARGFGIPEYGVVSDCGGSAYYTKAPDADLTDTRLTLNHDKGMYYHWCHDLRAHIYMLNYDECVCCWATAKPGQRGAMAAGQQGMRVGPEMLEYFLWDGDAADWKAVECADDACRALCSCAPEFTQLWPLLQRLAPIDRERFLLLSAGRVSRPESRGRWHEVQNMRSVRV